MSKDPTAETGGSEEGELSAVINGGGSPAEKCIKAVNKWLVVNNGLSFC